MNNTQQYLLFSAQTSHGYQKMHCKKILQVQMDGLTQAYAVEYKKNFDSTFKAWIKYDWLKFKNKYKS